MNPEEYTRMYTLEDKYWWYVGRRTLALGLMKKYLHGKRVLDVGCGTGVIFAELQKVAEPIGVDFSTEALDFSVKRGLSPFVQADGQALPFKEGTFDGAIGLDVFEHIPDDVKALKEVFRSLKPGGVLILSVPAFKTLWGPHDEALMHFRRYRAKEMGDKLRQAGFDVQKLSYSVFFLFPIVLAIRVFEKRKKGPAEASLPPVPGFMNKLLIALQSFEAKLIEGAALPWGSSVIAVARKPSV